MVTFPNDRHLYLLPIQSPSTPSATVRPGLLRHRLKQLVDRFSINIRQVFGGAWEKCLDGLFNFHLEDLEMGAACRKSMHSQSQNWILLLFEASPISPLNWASLSQKGFGQEK